MNEEIRYVTFGQDHRHEINGTVYDKDCIAIVHGDRAKVFELFGPKFCFEYTKDEWRPDVLKYFPRGYVDVK